MPFRGFRWAPFVIVGLAPLSMGAVGDGCAAHSSSPAPDTSGAWDITYDDALTVEVTIGGSTYTEELGPGGGVVTVEHDGHPLRFDLDCAKPEVLCPSEAWPSSVDIDQRRDTYEHRMIVTLPTQICSGALVEPAPGACGPMTDNPDCDDVCDGDVTVVDAKRFGVIGERGDSFRLYLGGGIATNGVNCALLGWSVADADLTTIGRDTDAWTATAMTSGIVEVGYAGGCLWVADSSLDAELEALALGARVKFMTGFTGERAP